MVGPELLGAILSRSSEASRNSRIHGPTHWAGVAAAGLTLLDRTPGADPLVVLLFAMLHDACRESDGHDPEHGARAASLARSLRSDGLLEVDDLQMRLLEVACEGHEKGITTDIETVGVCWDADRLNLWRVYRRPDPKLLSTSAARQLTGHAARVFSSLAFDWKALFLNFDPGGESRDRPVYLRFGDLPADGRSAVPYLGLRECGVSVYPGSKLQYGPYVLDFRRLLLGIDTRVLAWILSKARPLSLVEGRQAGIGGMGEPVLAGARVLEEVPARNVDVLPNRARFNALIEAWRLKREGKDPGPLAFAQAKEPDERPMLPLAMGNPLSGFGQAVEAGKRDLLKRWGLLEDYDRMQAQKRAQERAQAAWREAPWK